MMLFEFYKLLRTTPENQLNLEKGHIVKRFLDFMKSKDTSKDRSYYRTEYEEMKKIGLYTSSFEDYIYEVKLHFYRNLQTEYSHWKRTFEDNIKQLERLKVQCQKKIDSENGDASAKYQFLKGRIDEAISEQKKMLKPYNLIGDIINTAIVPDYAFCTHDELLRKAYAPFRWLTDWHEFMMFGELPPREFKRIQNLKEKKDITYLELFWNVVKEFKYVETIYVSFQKNPILNDRADIFSSALELFEANKYRAFVYLAVPQIEGLFHLYLQCKGEDVPNSKGMNDLATKLKNNEKDFLEYVYFAYDIPSLRNHIAHGELIDVTEEMALEILADIYWLVKNINDSNMPAMLWKDFLKECTDKKSCIEMILQKFNHRSFQSHAYIGSISKLLDGAFDEVIIKYELKEHLKIFKDSLCDDGLSQMIWEVDVKKGHVNDVHGCYNDFLEKISHYDELTSDKWKSWYECYKKVYEDKEKKVDEKFKSLLAKRCITK